MGAFCVSGISEPPPLNCIVQCLSQIHAGRYTNFCIWPFCAAADCVVLSHGLNLCELFFVVMQKTLQHQGYEVVV